MWHLRRLCFASVCLVSVVGQAQEPTPKYISVEDAKNYAIRNNFGIQALKAEVTAQDAAVAVSRSSLLPTIGIAGGVDVEGSAGQRETAPLSYVYGRMNLFNGFADHNEQRKNVALKEISESRYRQAVTELKLEVEKFFYNYLLKKQFIQFYDEALALNEKHLSAVRRRKASGLVSDSDLMDFELRKSFLNSEITKTRQELAEIKLNLVRTMGPELGLAFEPKGSLPHWHLEGNVDSYLSQVKEYSEAIAQAGLTFETALAQLNAARSGWFPKIDVEARFGALPLDERFNDNATSYSAGVVASWDLFSGFQTTAQTRKAEAELLREELMAKQTLLTVMAGVETSIRKLQSITTRVDQERDNEGRAQRLYKSTLAEFGRGVKNGADMKAAEESWLEAKTRRAELISEFITTRIEIERTYGIPVKVTQMDEHHK